jgi:hypothetical protein
MKRIWFWLAAFTLMTAALLPAEAKTVNWNENTGIDEVIAYPGFGD